MENKKNTILIIIITIIVLLVVVIGATFAYFATEKEVGSAINANVETAGKMYSFSASSNDAIEMDIPFNEMSQVNVTNTVLKSDNATIEVNLASPNNETHTACTYDIVWVWDSADMYTDADMDLPGHKIAITAEQYNDTNYTCKKGYSKKSVQNTETTSYDYFCQSAKIYNYEFSTIVDGENETDLSKLTRDEKKVILQSGISIEANSTTPTTKKHDITAKIYNLPVEQTNLFNKNFKAHITVDNLNCNMEIITIDKTAPNITNITKSPESGWGSSVTISFNANDPTKSPIETVSGIKETKCNGISGNSCTVTENGTYTLTATDYAGNTTTETVKVENIDNSAPSLTVSKSPTNYTCSNSVTFTLTGSDSQSGINTNTYYCNNYRSQTCSVYNSGTYNFSVTDNAGKTKTESVTVAFDDTRPVYNGGSAVTRSYLDAGNWSDNCGVTRYDFSYSTTYRTDTNSLYWYTNKPKQWSWVPNLTCGMTNYAWVRVYDSKGYTEKYLGNWSYC